MSAKPERVRRLPLLYIPAWLSCVCVDDVAIALFFFGNANCSPLPLRAARANSFVGTAEYVSPELLSQKYTVKSSDLWSLGCIIYQMITGRPPFRGVTEFLTFKKVQECAIVYPENFPDDAKDLISKLLVKDPETRLGASRYDDLKAHRFFKGIDFEKIHEMKPPKFQKSDIKLVFPEDILKEEEERKKAEKKKLHEKWGQFILHGEVHLRLNARWLHSWFPSRCHCHRVSGVSHVFCAAVCYHHRKSSSVA